MSNDDFLLFQGEEAEMDFDGDPLFQLRNDLHESALGDWDDIGDQVEEMEREYPDLDDWYGDIRREYGRPSNDAIGFLLEGDFAAFEQLAREGHEPPH